MVSTLVVADKYAELSPDSWRFFSELWRERSWVVRRVDQVKFLDRDRVQLSISFTIDNDRVRKVANQCNVGCTSGQVPLPLLLRQRTPILDLDTFDDIGRSLPVVSGSVNTYMAECILLTQAFPKPDFSDTDQQELFLRLSRDLFSSIRDGEQKAFNDLEKELERETRPHSNDDDNESDRQIDSYYEAEFEYYTYVQRFLDSVDVNDLDAFMQYHIFAVYVDCFSRRGQQVIKCRFVYPSGFEVGPAQFGRAFYRHEVGSGNPSSLDGRYHIRVEAPAGMRIASFDLYNVTVKDDSPSKRRMDKTMSRVSSTPSFLEVRVGDSVVKRTSEVRLDIAYTPMRSALIVPAVCLAAVYILMCIVLMQIHEPFTAYDGVAAVIAVLPTVAATVLLRSQVHDIARRASARTRFWTMVLATLMFIMCVVYALNLPIIVVLSVGWATIVLSAGFLASGLVSIGRISWHNSKYKKESFAGVA
ncbi:hypothetical protein SAMN04487766_106184 [Actinomyces ruminicola]|uniref:Uncharacterized protein n=1 Tax=Actinomyces ruminicola TaxID=332524 RepID=A0A1G9VXE2_9ACTO|nr:hypothetical protein SAMN04487766_106184 [Actinomyces ruminicola]